MTKISEKQFDELRRELDACVGASASFNVYKDDHDYLVLGIKPTTEGSEAFGIRFFYCTYISGPTKWDNAKLSVDQETFGESEILFVVKDAGAGFSVKCHGPIDFAGDRRRVFPKS